MLKNELDPFQNLTCSLLPGKYTEGVLVPDLYNSVYAYWRKTWTEFFIKAGSGPDALNIEDFMRHSFIISLHQGNNIVGTLSCSLFHLGADVTYDHPCIRPFPAEVLDTLRTERKGRCITGEYLSVHPEFRKNSVGISMADIMIGIMSKIFQNLELEMAFAATVRAAKVDIIAKKYGFRELGSYVKIGVDCIMVFSTQEMLQAHPDPTTMALVEKFWREREDLTGLTIQSREQILKVA